MDGKQKPVGAPKEEQPSIPPMAMAELEIMKVEGAKSTASKSPEIRNIALLLIVLVGVTVFSQIVSYLIVESFNTTRISFFSFFVSSNGVLGITLLLIEVIAIFILLFTRNTSHAKTILLVAGIGFGVTLVNSIISFQVGPSIMANIAVLVVTTLILQKIFKAYLDL